YVPRHFLCANQHALELRIVDRRKVRPRTDVDVESRAREQLNGRVLQGAFGNSELQFHVKSSNTEGTEKTESHGGLRSWSAYSVASVLVPLASVLKKHVRSPVWQTLPSPRRFTLTSTVSSSQSVSISTTWSLLPDVSPFIHSLLRVRLKKVAKPV